MEMIKGEIYVVTNNPDIIFMWEKGDAASYYIGQNAGGGGRYLGKNGGCFYSNNEYRLANQDEINHLMACIEADTFVSKPTLELIPGKYYTCIAHPHNTFISKGGNLISHCTMGNKNEYHKNKDWANGKLGKEYKLATKEEIEHLDKCIFAGRFVSREEIPKYKVGDVVITKGYSTTYDGKPLKIKEIKHLPHGIFCYFEPDGSANFHISHIIGYAEKVKEYEFQIGDEVRMNKFADNVYGNCLFASDMTPYIGKTTIITSTITDTGRYQLNGRFWPKETLTLIRTKQQIEEEMSSKHVFSSGMCKDDKPGIKGETFSITFADNEFGTLSSRTGNITEKSLIEQMSPFIKTYEQAMFEINKMMPSKKTLHKESTINKLNLKTIKKQIKRIKL